MTSPTERNRLPPDLRLQGASFYSDWGLISNVRVCRKGQYDCVTFDFDSNTGEVAHTDTVIAVKSPSPKQPSTWLSRSSGFRFERVGEWILAFQPDSRIDADKVDSAVDDVIKLIEYAQEFPQNQ